MNGLAGKSRRAWLPKLITYSKPAQILYMFLSFVIATPIDVTIRAKCETYKCVRAEE